MHCPNCGAENNATNAFCQACGTPLGATCATCGQVNQPEARFCGRCGTPLVAAAAAQSSEQLLRSLAASGGERKRLTVMFADIRNSTTLVDRVDPEDAIRKIQPALDAMRAAVDRHEGVVNRVQGDGVMALFGAPRPHEDHAVRACLAALEMQHAVARLGDPDITIRVGLHTGEVVVRAVGTSLYQTYDVAGAVAHIASRMEQMAESGGVLLTGDTYAAARQFIDVKSLGRQTVRGVLQPIEVLQLTGMRQAAASELFRSRPRLSPLIGRGHELAALEAELENAARGNARVVGIVGEAGVGKSRLCFEFAESCRRRVLRVLEARVLSHGRATPFQSILELLRDAFGITAGSPPEEARKRVRDATASLRWAEDRVALLLDFLGLGDPAQPAPQLDPAVRKNRLMEIVRDLARSAPRERARVIMIQDLHWIDAASEEFIEAFADAVVGTTTLLLLNFRPGYSAPWMQRSHYRQLNVSQLEAGSADELLHDLLGDHPSLALIRRNITERAQGNPFFIEELVNSLVERGDFEGGRGAYRLPAGIDTIPLPPSVEAVLAARIDRLEETAKQVLQSAAVIGREQPTAILAAVSALPSGSLEHALRQLRGAELLYELPPHERGLHAFRHPLIQEVAYGSLLQDRRRRIHGCVAAAMKTRLKGRAEEWASLLAYHLEQAGDTMQAAQAHIRAALWLGANDAAQALLTWRKVYEQLTLQPPSESIAYLRSMACYQIINLGWREGIDPEEAHRCFEEAKALFLAASNVRGYAALCATFGRNLAARGSADDYVARVREADALVANSDDASFQVTIKAMLCHALRLAGLLHEALGANVAASARADEVGGFYQEVAGFDLGRWLVGMRGQILVALGRFDEARPQLDRLLQTDPGRTDITHHMASVAYVDLACAEGELALAEHHAARAFALATSSGSHYERVNAQASRGLAHLAAGRHDAAIKDLSQALSYARRRQVGLEIEPRILADLANTRRLAGDLEGALATASEAIAVATARHHRIPECLARIVQAHALQSLERSAEEAEELARARALMQETGAEIYRPLLDGVGREQAAAAGLGLDGGRNGLPQARSC